MNYHELSHPCVYIMSLDTKPEPVSASLQSRRLCASGAVCAWSGGIKSTGNRGDLQEDPPGLDGLFHGKSYEIYEKMDDLLGFSMKNSPSIK